jgi:hypothetical protein
MCAVLAFVGDVRVGERVLGPHQFVAGTFVRWAPRLPDLEATHLGVAFLGKDAEIRFPFAYISV